MPLNDDFLHGMGIYLDGVAVRYMRTVKFATNPDNTTFGKLPDVYDFSLVREGNGVNIAIPINPVERTFKAYWCPNQANESRSVTLGAKAMIFFTPALTGCVLEIDGNTITHHDGHAPQRDGVEAALPRGGKVGHRCWTNGEYMSSMVIGARLSGRWRFFQQSLNFGETTPLELGRATEISLREESLRAAAPPARRCIGRKTS